MARNDNNPLLLLRTVSQGDAWSRFEKFVKDSGGDDVNLNNVRCIFEEWKNLKVDEHAVCLTRKTLVTAQKLKTAGLAEDERKGSFLQQRSCCGRYGHG